MDASVAHSTATVVISHSVQIMDGLNMALDKVDHILSSPILMHLVTWVVALFGGGSCFKWLKNRQVEKVSHIAFMAVEEAARRTDNEALDKAALFTTHFEAMMKRSGWWGLNPDDTKHAQAIADALNLAYENAKALAAKDPAPAAAPVVPAKPEVPGAPK
jgi:hypothetical protein